MDLLNGTDHLLEKRCLLIAKKEMRSASKFIDSCAVKKY